MAALTPLVTARWLAENRERADIKILDGTWIMPGTAPVLPEGFIPGAQFFDIDLIADLSSPMKHMLPSAEVFAKNAGEMGIYADDCVIVYDRHGVHTSPRLWWTFRMFGHKNVAVLDGGLPAWVAAGYDVAQAPAILSPVVYQPAQALSGLAHMQDVKDAIGRLQIVDARPLGRFYGTSPEPRKGLRSGHIPGSRSLPFTHLIKDGHVLPMAELEKLFDEAGVDRQKPIITSCGSGITAAGLAFALHLLGARDVSVYDGSWTEWGGSDAPIATG